MPKKSENKTVRVTLVKSPIGYTEAQKANRSCAGTATHESDCGTPGFTRCARDDHQDHPFVKG